MSLLLFACLLIAACLLLLLLLLCCPVTTQRVTLVWSVDGESGALSVDVVADVENVTKVAWPLVLPVLVLMMVTMTIFFKSICGDDVDTWWCCGGATGEDAVDVCGAGTGPDHAVAVLYSGHSLVRPCMHGSTICFYCHCTQILKF